MNDRRFDNIGFCNTSSFDAIIVDVIEYLNCCHYASRFHLTAIRRERSNTIAR